MFPYAFKDIPDYPSAKPELEGVEVSGPFDVFGVRIVPVPLFHGEMPVLGFRIGPFAYCTDCSRIPEESIALLQDLQTLILVGLRHRPHPTHFNLKQAIEMARRIGARQTFFTHIAHELPHEATNATLPSGMALAYDGQVIEIKDEG
jgi:phosphoribosyl 1,2-cyclic phosphate phosphodiesterase